MLEHQSRAAVTQVLNDTVTKYSNHAHICVHICVPPKKITEASSWSVRLTLPQQRRNSIHSPSCDPGSIRKTCNVCGTQHARIAQTCNGYHGSTPCPSCSAIHPHCKRACLAHIHRGPGSGPSGMSTLQQDSTAICTVSSLLCVALSPTKNG
jgi:hypothetical protein